MNYEPLNNIPNPEHQRAAREVIALLEKLEALALKPEPLSEPLAAIYLGLTLHRFSLERLARSLVA